MPRSDAFVRYSIDATHRGGTDRYWVAVEAGAGIIGFVQLRRGLSTAFVNNIHVVPERQGKGVASRLLRLMTTGIDAPEVSADVFTGARSPMGSLGEPG